MAGRGYQNNRGGRAGSQGGSNNENDWLSRLANNRSQPQGRGGYKGKSFDPNYHSRFNQQGNQGQAAPNNLFPSQPQDQTNENNGRQSTYKGKNFDPNYHLRSNQQGPFSGNSAGQSFPPQNQNNSTLPTGPRSRSKDRGGRGERRNNSGGANRAASHDHYYYRKRKYDQDADTWMCSCPHPPTDCHSALICQHQTKGQEYRTRLATGEHDIEVMKLSMERFVARFPQFAEQLAKCYNEVEKEVIEREYSYFQGVEEHFASIAVRQ
ncbi:hypothetical protein AB5N19_13607 [Seiridium cardinale]